MTAALGFRRVRSLFVAKDGGGSLIGVVLGFAVAAALATLALLFTHAIAGAAPTCTNWTGPSGGDFATAANWSNDQVPGSSTWVCSSASAKIALNSSITVEGGVLKGSLTLGSGASLSYADTSNASTIGTLTDNGGTFDPSGPVSLTGGGSSGSTWSAGTIYGPGSSDRRLRGHAHRRRSLRRPPPRSATVVDGTFNVAATTTTTGCSWRATAANRAPITVPSGGALNLALDDPSYAMITDDGGSPTITSTAGAPWPRPAARESPPSTGVHATASGTLCPRRGPSPSNGVTLAGNPTGVGNVALTGSTTVSGNATLSGNWQVDRRLDGPSRRVTRSPLTGR